MCTACSFVWNLWILHQQDWQMTVLTSLGRYFWIDFPVFKIKRWPPNFFIHTKMSNDESVNNVQKEKSNAALLLTFFFRFISFGLQTPHLDLALPVIRTNRIWTQKANSNYWVKEGSVVWMLFVFSSLLGDLKTNKQTNIFSHHYCDYLLEGSCHREEEFLRKTKLLGWTLSHKYEIVWELPLTIADLEVETPGDTNGSSNNLPSFCCLLSSALQNQKLVTCAAAAGTWRASYLNIF